MEKVKVRFLRDDDDIKVGTEIYMKKEEAEMYLEEGNGLIEIVETEQDRRKKEAKLLRDKNVIEKVKDRGIKDAMALGVDPENYIAIKKEKIKKDKKLEEIEELKESFFEYVRDKKYGDASECIAQYIMKNNYIYTTKDDDKSEVWIYKEGVYVPDGRTEIKIMMRDILGKSYSNWWYNQVIAKIEPDTAIDTDNFFNTIYVEEVPVQNGILNVLTREMKPFNPEKVFFNKLPVVYDPEAKCNKIHSFLDEVLPNTEDKKVFYEIGGFCLLKEYKFEKAFMLVGDGRNGKGKAIELIKRTIGAENCYSLSLSALSNDNPDVSQLFGKMVNLAGDISNTDLKDTAMFKGLTGRDLITAKRKFKSAITFENYAKFIFACNELPMVYDLSKGFWDRWVLLEFPYYFADKEEYELTRTSVNTNWKMRDEDIINKITTSEELSGLLNEFLDGLDRLLKNRKFSSTKGSEQVKDTWIRKSNSVISFCMDTIEENYESTISKKDFRKRYSEYCKKYKVTSKSDIVIKRVLQDMFGTSEERMENKQTGSWDWYWVGVKWK